MSFYYFFYFNFNFNFNFLFILFFIFLIFIFIFICISALDARERWGADWLLLCHLSFFKPDNAGNDTNQDPSPHKHVILIQNLIYLNFLCHV